MVRQRGGITERLAMELRLMEEQSAASEWGRYTAAGVWERLGEGVLRDHYRQDARRILRLIREYSDDAAPVVTETPEGPNGH